MKPKQQGGYTSQHTQLCERTLVTPLRGLGPWKQGIVVTGGLVPRYLITAGPTIDTHVGTTDVDLVLNLTLLGEVEAYRRLEQNLKNLGFERGKNDEGAPQHFSWRKPLGEDITIVVDLLCDSSAEEGGRVRPIEGERRLSALGIPGAYLVMDDFIEVTLTEELLDERGEATETVRITNIAPFLTLKCLAYEDRFEEKDAYDIIYCLRYYREGPFSVAAAFADALLRRPNDPFLLRALDILRQRFATDTLPGYRKDGPVSYARFLANPGRTDRNPVNQRDAAGAVESFLIELDRLRTASAPTDNDDASEERS